MAYDTDTHAVAAAHGHATFMGLDNRKMAFWAFIGSECLLFASLISTYLIYKGRSQVGPYPHEILNIPFTSFSTFDLLMSSLAMVLALAAVQRGDMKQGKLWLLITALLGLIFLGGQVWEFSHFYHEGLGLTTLSSLRRSGLNCDVRFSRWCVSGAGSSLRSFGIGSIGHDVPLID